MAKKSDITCRLEYAAFRTICATMNAVPYRMACWLAAGVARVAFDIFHFKRARTLTRIREAFPQMSAREVRLTAVTSLENILLDAIEMIRAPRFDRAWVEKHVTDAPMYAERLAGYLKEGHGAVIMVPHCGNWYMAAWAMAACGVPLFALAARQRNPYLNDWMHRQYGKGLDVLERGSTRTMREILARLKQGRAFAILPDLRVPQPDVAVPFLNGTANVSHAGALFAVTANAPIVVAIMRRERGIHIMEHLATLRPDPTATDRTAEAARLTREAFKHIDQAIRRSPGQWYWFNKRWILQPVNPR